MMKKTLCGTEVDENTAQWTSEYMGKKYYFCAESCKQKFDDNPLDESGQVKDGCY